MKAPRCPTCINTMILDLDKAVYRCINCARVWTQYELETLGFVYDKSSPKFLNLTKPPPNKP